MKSEPKKIKNERNNGIIIGLGSILISLSFLSREGLSGLVIFSGIVGIVCLLIAYKIHKEINN